MYQLQVHFISYLPPSCVLLAWLFDFLDIHNSQVSLDRAARKVAGAITIDLALFQALPSSLRQLLLDSFVGKRVALLGRTSNRLFQVNNFFRSEQWWSSSDMLGCALSFGL